MLLHDIKAYERLRAVLLRTNLSPPLSEDYKMQKNTVKLKFKKSLKKKKKKPTVSNV